LFKLCHLELCSYHVPMYVQFRYLRSAIYCALYRSCAYFNGCFQLQQHLKLLVNLKAASDAPSKLL
jgi:hypothetical protein